MANARLIALFIAACASLAIAQTSTGSVGGTVRDQTGAVIPGASVALTNVDTNVVSRTTTTGVGYFLYPAVLPGKYRIDIELTGMQKYTATLTVQTQQGVTLEPTLQTGQVSTAIEVQDVTPMVTTDRPSLGYVLERTRIEQLPINGRDFENLLRTVPGMEGQRAYGTREGSAEVTLDGSPLSDRVRPRSQVRPPGLDTIQEFKVETNSSSAKFNRPTTIILTTRSGTNQSHGSLFETHRNNAIGKARQRQDTYEKPPQLIRNEFGGSAGGPVWIPKLYNGRNRTFWFYSFEGYRRVNSSTKSFAIPTDAMWNGDFSDLKDSQGRLFTLYDPWTTTSTFARQPFAYGGRTNVIDPKKASPLGKHLASITPRPTLTDVNPLVADNWWGPVPSWNRNWTNSFRFDHRFTDRDNFYARYTQGDSREMFGGYYGVPMTDRSSNEYITTSPNKSLALSWTRTFSPTLFNEMLATVSRERNYNGNVVEKDFAGMLGLPNPFGSKSFPVINTVGFGDLKYQPHNMNGAFNTYYLLDDNVTKIAGRHELQFGAHLRWDYVNLLPDQAATAGSVVPSAYATSLWDSKGTLQSPLAVARTGHTLANLWLGVNRYQMRLNHGMFYGRSKEYAIYLQDNWKVTSRLTLNLGLRWEMWPAYREKYNNIVTFDKERRAIVLAEPMEHYYKIGAVFPGVVKEIERFGGKFISYKEAGLPQSLIQSNWFDLGPRLGFAYRMGGSQRAAVLRGGFRMSYFPIPMRGWSEYARGSAPHTAYLAYDLDDSALAPDGLRAWTLRNAPTVISGVNSKNVIDPNSNVTGITRGSLNANFFSSNQDDTRVTDWNFTFEKEILQNTAVKVTYVGNHVDNLELFVDHNKPAGSYVWYATQGVPTPSGEYASVAMRPYDNQFFAGVQEYGKWGWSNSNAVQFEVERRYSKGVGFQLFYVMTNAFTAGGHNWSDILPPTNTFMPGIVPENFEERVRFLRYQRDTTIPKHRVRWNWVADLPFGKGKFIGRHAGSWMNRLIGGWQLAGMGSVNSNYFALPTGIWPTGEKIEQYGYKYPIDDCRSGRCYPGYLWWNGYIPANQINSVDANGKPTGVMGVPSSYKPAAQYLNPWPANPDRNDPMYSFYGTNTVWVPMKDGSQQRTTFDPGDHPWRNQSLPGVRRWGMDASLFKSIPITESVRVRFNADFFNVFNAPGNPNSIGSDGILSTRTSGTGSRELQLSLRLMW